MSPSQLSKMIDELRRKERKEINKIIHDYAFYRTAFNSLLKSIELNLKEEPNDTLQSVLDSWKTIHKNKSFTAKIKLNHE